MEERKRLSSKQISFEKKKGSIMSIEELMGLGIVFQRDGYLCEDGEVEIYSLDNVFNNLALRFEVDEVVSKKDASEILERIISVCQASIMRILTFEDNLQSKEIKQL